LVLFADEDGLHLLYPFPFLNGRCVLVWFLMRRAYAQGLSLSLDCMLLMRYFLPGCASLLHLEKAFRIIHALFEPGKILSTFCFLLYAYFPFAISLSLSLFS